MKDLQNITICIVDCKNYDNAAKSIIYCSRFCNINFKKAIYISDIKHNKLEKYNIDFIKTEKITSARQYDNFMIKNLKNFIETDYVLIVQHDGIIYKPEKWTDEFLNYDYIGAPWPASPKGTNRVGNGGFCLRSKKFISRSSEILGDKYCAEAEDVFLCCTIYKQMKEEGFNYPSVELASQFSYEQPYHLGSKETFGFHLAACGSDQDHKNFRDKAYEDLHKNW